MKFDMRKLTTGLSVLAISVTTLISGGSQASAAEGYYPSGPQLNVPISTITNSGWQLCWSGLYGATDSLSNIENSCTGKFLLEAAGAVGASSYILAAAGERTSVLKVTGLNETTFNNGTYWYYGKNDFSSMGFAPISKIFQNSADCYYNGEATCNFNSSYVEGADPTANYRMSWHLDNSGQIIFGGWRIGHINWLNSSNDYVRAIYQSNQPAEFVTAKLDSVKFEDDGTGTGGKLSWSGKFIDSVLFSGPGSIYPGAFNLGAFTSSWNGKLINLQPNTKYTVSLYAVSSFGLGEGKTITFETGNSKEVKKDLSYWISWLKQNTYFDGESSNMITLLSKFDALNTDDHSSSMWLPMSRVSKVTAKSLTSDSCSVYSNGYVRALSKDTCTISYTVTGPSKAPATLVKDFVFNKYAK